MSNVTRNHKDNVFCLLYRDRKNLLSLYNAVNGTSYAREEELEVVTLEQAMDALKVPEAERIKYRERLKAD